MAITGDILERILRATVLKNVLMEISKYRSIKFSHFFLNCEILESDISPPQMTKKKKRKKKNRNSTYNQLENKTVYHIGLLNLS